MIRELATRTAGGPTPAPEAPENTWICARCGRAVDPTTNLYISVRPGRRALIWHPACPPAARAMSAT